MKDYSIISMSKVYEGEDFYKPFSNALCYLDCSDIEGTNCFADERALAMIRERIGCVKTRGIHFIDSGNFHYLTYLFLERIEIDFALVLIDNHPDCKSSMFDELLSCGGWVANALNSLGYLRHVYMVGVSSKLLYELDDLSANKSKVSVISDYTDVGDDLPIYISIDKDALDDSILTTNWDHGNMTLNELEKWLSELTKRDVLGIDICGEPNRASSGEHLALSDEVNKHLLSFFLQKYRATL